MSANNSDKRERFTKIINEGYSFCGDSIHLGGAMLDGDYVPGTAIRAPLSMLNRHGLIAGATGTGKTKTLQVIAEELSAKSVPLLLMDIKGDLSGLAAPGASDAAVRTRCEKIGISQTPQGFPVELLTISSEKGVRLRSTISEFGPILLSKILGLNETQSGIISVVFKYCDDAGLLLLDIKDLKRVLQHITREGKQSFEASCGRVSLSTTGTILRKIIELEQEHIERFFGEKSFEVDDLTGIDDKGYGIISILRLSDMQSLGALFSTFMLSLLAEIYSTFPEEGDLPAPKLVIFIDEAHIIFNEASKALLEQIEIITRLIRSKGVGLFFCTQNPVDIPNSVLSQLGMKVQHSLRAFTARDRKSLKLAAENYPSSQFYETDALLTTLGIGEALITVLDEKGAPTPLAATLLRPPRSRMAPLSEVEITEIVKKSKLVPKYNQEIDRESAYELLNKKIEETKEAEEAYLKKTQASQVIEERRAAPSRKKVEKGFFDSPLVKQVGRSVTGAVAREVTRGILGVLGLGGRSRRR